MLYSYRGAVWMRTESERERDGSGFGATYDAPGVARVDDVTMLSTIADGGEWVRN